MKPLLIAISTLTLFPIPTGRGTPSQLRTSAAFFPVAGALIGGLLVFSKQLPFPHDLKALLVLLLWVLVTGAFHLDGLGDCLDGFFGGESPSERRSIMKGSSLGAYGVVGIVLILLFKYVVLSRFLSQPEAWKWLLFIPVAARWGVTLSCAFFQAPAGDSGLGSKVMGLTPGWFGFSTLATLVMGIALLKIQVFTVLLIAGFIAVAVGLFSRSRVKGLTGDGMGATIELSETILLFFACVALTKGFFDL
jgi:adenosylcobinamide-GDP ribazoletransferase